MASTCHASSLFATTVILFLCLTEKHFRIKSSATNIGSWIVKRTSLIFNNDSHMFPPYLKTHILYGNVLGDSNHMCNSLHKHIHLLYSHFRQHGEKLISICHTNICNHTSMLGNPVLNL